MSEATQGDFSTPTVDGDISYQSKARLRTQTGCLICRKRRKKCDEVRPRCKGCTRNGLECTWPTVADLVDRRRGPWSWKSQQSLRGASSGLNLQPADYVALLSHFATSVAPHLVREDCRPEYSNPEYTLRLAHDSPPLMAIIIAIAALDLKTPRHERLAMESYLFSLHSLRVRLANAPNAGNEDALLATTIHLCIFENLRPDAQSNFNLHATATGALLAQREPAQTRNRPRSVTAFERFCAESFLYHGSLMMLFNPSLDALANVDYMLDWARYFSNSQTAAETWSAQSTHPVLEASYDFFLLIARVTRLARVSRPLDEEEVQTWKHLSSQLLQFKQVASQDTLKPLHLEAMHIMLLKVHPVLPESEIMEQIYSVLRRGLSTVHAVDTQKHLIGYLLWPLTVFGSIAVDSANRRLVNRLIFELALRGNGRVVQIQNWLRYIWELPQADEAIMTRRGLQILVEGSESGMCVGEQHI